MGIVENDHSAVAKIAVSEGRPWLWMLFETVSLGVTPSRARGNVDRGTRVVVRIFSASIHDRVVVNGQEPDA